MKVITEATLRNELKAEHPEAYIVPDNMMLSPAAREYLQMQKIKVVEKKQNKPLTISYSEPVEQNSNPRITPEYKKKVDPQSEEEPAKSLFPRLLRCCQPHHYVGGETNKIHC